MFFTTLSLGHHRVCTTIEAHFVTTTTVGATIKSNEKAVLILGGARCELGIHVRTFEVELRHQDQ